MRRLHAFALFVAALPAAASAAELKLARVFSDHMMLQRGREIPVFGRAAPGAEVSVQLGKSKASAVAGKDGRFVVRLPAQSASAAPQELSAKSGQESIAIADVLVGDVWLCSGQSNMEWPMKNFADTKAACDAADVPDMRLLQMRRAGDADWTFEEDTLDHAKLLGMYTGTWTPCTPATVAEFSAVGYGFGRALHDQEKVPIGLIQNAIGGSPIEAWMSRGNLAGDPATAAFVTGEWAACPLLHPWIKSEAENYAKQVCEMKAKADAAGTPMPKIRCHPFEPTALFDAGIAPLAPFALSGVIWYQGESNGNDGKLYETLFRNMVAEWRARLEQPALPIYWVQLAGWGPGEDWPPFRAAQQDLMSLPNSGMATAVDLGHTEDIHPPGKLEVGRRLSLWARAQVYGEKIETCGPVAKSVEARNNELIVHFDHAAKLQAGREEVVASAPVEPKSLEEKIKYKLAGRVKGFEVAGSDGVFKAATASIDGLTVVVHCLEVAEPAQVRYAWKPLPECSLYNGDGLPAFPFLLQVAK